MTSVINGAQEVHVTPGRGVGDTDLQTAGFPSRPKVSKAAVPFRKFKLSGLNPRHMMIELLALSALFAGGSYARVRFAELIDGLEAEVRLDRSLARDPWPSNVSVLASTRQDRDSFLSGGYTVQLLENLGDRHYGSLKEAHIPLERGLGGVLRPLAQTPVASFGGGAAGWIKGEKKERFVIAAAGEHGSGESWWETKKGAKTHTLERLAEDVVASFKQVFLLPEENITVLHQPAGLSLKCAAISWRSGTSCTHASMPG